MKKTLSLFCLTMIFAATSFGQIIKDVKFMDSEGGKRLKKNLEVEYIDEDGAKREKYTLTIESDGEISITVWDGIGEMPSSIKEAIEESKNDTGNVDLQAKKVYEKKIIPKREVPALDEPIKAEIPTSDLPKFMLGGNRTALGMTVIQGHEGIKVDYIQEGSDAEKAGILSGDVLLKINQQYILTLSLFDRALGQYEIGKKNQIMLLRDGREIQLIMK